MQEMRVWSLGQEDPLEKQMVNHFSILAWDSILASSTDRGAWWATVHGFKIAGHSLVTKTTHVYLCLPPSIQPSISLWFF